MRRSPENLEYLGPLLRHGEDILLCSSRLLQGLVTGSTNGNIYAGSLPPSPLKESVGAPDQMTVSQHSKSEGWHPSPLFPPSPVCSVICV
jgi:hypothetical protein